MLVLFGSTGFFCGLPPQRENQVNCLSLTRFMGKPYSAEEMSHDKLVISSHSSTRNIAEQNKYMSKIPQSENVPYYHLSCFDAYIIIFHSSLGQTVQHTVIHKM